MPVTVENVPCGLDETSAAAIFTTLASLRLLACLPQAVTSKQEPGMLGSNGEARRTGIWPSCDNGMQQLARARDETLKIVRLRLLTPPRLLVMRDRDACLARCTSGVQRIEKGWRGRAGCGCRRGGECCESPSSSTMPRRCQPRPAIPKRLRASSRSRLHVALAAQGRPRQGPSNVSGRCSTSPLPQLPSFVAEHDSR